jgi:hypothetical protein
MFLWFLSDGRYPTKIEEIDSALNKMRNFLDKENLLKGLEVSRPETEVPVAEGKPAK